MSGSPASIKVKHTTKATSNQIVNVIQHSSLLGVYHLDYPELRELFSSSLKRLVLTRGMNYVFRILMILKKSKGRFERFWEVCTVLTLDNHHKADKKNHMNWSVHAYNCTVLTGYSPFNLLFGRLPISIYIIMDVGNDHEREDVKGWV